MSNIYVCVKCVCVWYKSMAPFEGWKNIFVLLLTKQPKYCGLIKFSLTNFLYHHMTRQEINLFVKISGKTTVCNMKNSMEKVFYVFPSALVLSEQRQLQIKFVICLLHSGHAIWTLGYLELVEHFPNDIWYKLIWK